MPTTFLSCDWGTTSFRLRLVNAGDLSVAAQLVSLEGISTTHERWKKQESVTPRNREEFFLNRLQEQVKELENMSGMQLANTDLIISGMASSSIGIRELPYTSLPFALDGSEANASIIPTGAGGRRVLLISGVSAGRDVMRGEETQITGLFSLLAAEQQEETVCIFPGTHSKHLQMKAGKLFAFQTFLTGELFDLMVNHSILKESVESGSGPMDAEDVESFCAGIDQAGEFNLLHSLFSVRVNHLFKLISREKNFYFLSGLLIGSELMALTKQEGLRIQLCSGSNLYNLYKLAIEKLALADNTVFISPNLMDLAVVTGQWAIGQKYMDR